MSPNRIWGSQAETQQWALEIKPKGYRCGVSPPKQGIEAAPNKNTTIKHNKHVSIVNLLYY